MLSFFVGQTKLCLAQGTLLVNVLLIRLLLFFQSGISAELSKEITEGLILRPTLYHVTGEETEHGVCKQAEVKQGKNRVAPEHPQNR